MSVPFMTLASLAAVPVVALASLAVGRRQGRQQGQQQERQEASAAQAEPVVEPVAVVSSPVGAPVAASVVPVAPASEAPEPAADSAEEPLENCLNDYLNDYAVYHLDRTGCVVQWRETCASGRRPVGGYETADMVGQSHRVLFTPEDCASDLPARLLHDAAEKGRVDSEGWRMGKNGSRFWAHLIVVAHAAKGQAASGEDEAGAAPFAFTCALRDTTSRRLQEDRIRFQAALLNRVRNAILATDSHGCLVYMNSYAEELFLLPWRQAAGQHISDLGLFVDDLMPPLPSAAERAAERAADRKASDDGQPTHDRHRMEREIEAFRRDGTRFPALCVTTISPDPSGEGYAEVHLIHDLTELKKMQAALQHSAKLALLGRMSASLVHEISQPMNVIRLTAEGGLMKLSRHGLTDDELSERLQTIANQAARLFDTIDFMQLFSRRDSGRTPLASASLFDVCRSVRESVGVLRPSFQQAAVGLELDLPDTACQARGRSRQFEQVLINLLNNALQAVCAQPQDEARLRRVRVTVSEAALGAILLAIEDTGPGIPDDLRHEIFEPFFTSKPAGEGTGLGLSISLGIVQAMGGTLEASRASLGGARFELRLPRPEGGVPLPTAPLKAAVPDDEPQHHSQGEECRGHVLVVDDEELARKEIAEHLHALGFAVSVASGGHQALEILERCAEAEEQMASEGPPDGPFLPTVLSPIDVVVTDLRMPDGDGFELIARLADDYPQIFTIVVTGQPLSEREDLQGVGSNADAVLRKPVSLSVLTEHLLGLFDGGE